MGASLRFTRINEEILGCKEDWVKQEMDHIIKAFLEMDTVELEGLQRNAKDAAKEYKDIMRELDLLNENAKALWEEFLVGEDSLYRKERKIEQLLARCARV